MGVVYELVRPIRRSLHIQAQYRAWPKLLRKNSDPKLPKIGVTCSQNTGLHIIPGRNVLNRCNFSPRVSSESLAAP